MKKFVSVLYLLSVLNTSLYSQQNFWRSTNGPYAPGYVTAINASSNGKVYVALNRVGLYRSTDTGLSFSYVNGELTNTQIESILINQAGHILVGILEWPYRGLSRSTDDGNTWIQELPSTYVKVMAMDSDGYIYAGTNDSGIFRSSDDGDNWTQIDVESTIRTTTSLEFSPAGYVFASGFKVGWSEDRALRSSDKGITWDSLIIPQEIYIKNFAFSSNGNIVASFHPHSPSDSSGFLLSADNGTTWVRKNIIRSYYGIYSLLFDEPSNSFYAVVYNVTDWDIIKSTDYGNTWHFVSSIDYNQPDNFSFESNQQDRLFVGSIDGFKYSSDLGYNWIQSDSGFYATGSNNLTYFPFDRLFVGTSKGNFRLAEDKMNWLKDSALVGSFLISNTGEYILSNGDIHKSTDNGNSWFTAFEPMLSFSATTELTQASNGYLFAGGYENGGVHGTGWSMVWRSTDYGEIWDVVYSNSGDRLINTVTKIPGNTMIAGGKDGEIIQSTDLGETWYSSNGGIPSDARIVVIRVGRDGVIFAGSTSYGIFRSIDSGLTWEIVNNGLNSLEVRTISINSIGKVFAGTQSGVFVSIDNGDNWNSLNSGLLDVSILSLLCDSLDYLYAATNSTGVYKSNVSTTSVDESSTDFLYTYQLNQNYPNPFNPTTKISYQIANTSFVLIRVYDILGREVATLVNEEKPAGTYKVEFNGSDLTSGIYFYQLKANDYSETRKMILLK